MKNQIKLNPINQKSNPSHKLEQEDHNKMNNTWLSELKNPIKEKHWPYNDDKYDQDTFSNTPAKDYVIRKGYRVNKTKKAKISSKL